MFVLKGKTVFHKLWYFLRVYILTIPRFDLFLQGALFVLVLLDNNVYLLLRRDAVAGHIPTLIEDWVHIGTGGMEFLFGALLAWSGRGRRNFALSAWLATTALSGLMVLAFPFAKDHERDVELCGGQPISLFASRSTAEDPLVTSRIVFLIITATLCALAKISIWAHGTTYLDDHEPQNGPYFYGILISIRLSVGIAGESWLRPASERNDWWKAQVSLAMLVLMFAILYTFFPSKMPYYKEEDKVVDDGLLATLGRLIRNKPLVMQTLALAFLNAALFGFVHHDDYYVQARFHIESIRQDPRSSRVVGDILRSLVIIFFVSVFRMRFSVRRSDGVKASTAARVGGVVAILVAVFFTVLAALYCGTKDIVGVENRVYIQPSCSQQCGCNSEKYGFTPMCGLDTVSSYFSPCHAGCHQYEDLNGFLLFHNCTCGTQRAVRGACTLDACLTAFTLYQLFFALVMALAAAALLMQGMAVLRSVRSRSDKVTAVGASFAVIALLSQGPGHVLYMIISKLTCDHISNGACVLHGSSVWSLAVTSAVLALISALISLAASRVPCDATIQTAGNR